MQVYKSLSSQHVIYLKEEPKKQSRANPFARKATYYKVHYRHNKPLPSIYFHENNFKLNSMIKDRSEF